MLSCGLTPSQPLTRHTRPRLLGFPSPWTRRPREIVYWRRRPTGGRNSEAAKLIEGEADGRI